MLLASLLLLAAKCPLTDGGAPPSAPLPNLPADVYVDVEASGDSAADGTLANPFRSISAALSSLYQEAGVESDTSWGGPLVRVHVAPGIYSRNQGEEDHLVLNNVEVIGKGSAPEDVTIAVGITIRTPSHLGSVRCTEDVTIYGRGVKAAQADASATVEEVHAASILVEDWDEVFPGGVHIDSCEIGGIRGHSFFGSLRIRDCVITGGSGVNVSSGSSSQGEVLIEDCVIEDCSVGIQILGADEATYLRNSITDCFPGLHFDSGSKYTLGGNAIHDCYYGIIVGGARSGEVQSLGGNSLSGSAKYALADTRHAYSGDFVLPADLLPGGVPSSVEGPADDPPLLVIENEGNRLLVPN